MCLWLIQLVLAETVTYSHLFELLKYGIVAQWQNVRLDGVPLLFIHKEIDVSDINGFILTKKQEDTIEKTVKMRFLRRKGSPEFIFDVY